MGIGFLFRVDEQVFILKLNSGDNGTIVLIHKTTGWYTSTGSTLTKLCTISVKTQNVKFHLNLYRILYLHTIEG